MTLRLLPDEELLVMGFLTDVDCQARMPANVATKLPLRLVYKIGGVAAHPRFLDKPLVHVASLAGSRDDAKALAETARVALFNGWQAQTRTTHGVIHKLIESTSPFEVRTNTEPDGVWRFDATYQVWTRP